MVIPCKGPFDQLIKRSLIHGVTKRETKHDLTFTAWEKLPMVISKTRNMDEPPRRPKKHHSGGVPLVSRRSATATFQSMTETKLPRIDFDNGSILGPLKLFFVETVLHVEVA